MLKKLVALTAILSALSVNAATISWTAGDYSSVGPSNLFDDLDISGPSFKYLNSNINNYGNIFVNTSFYMDSASSVFNYAQLEIRGTADIKSLDGLGYISNGSSLVKIGGLSTIETYYESNNSFIGIDSGHLVFGNNTIINAGSNFIANNAKLSFTSNSTIESDFTGTGTGRVYIGGTSNIGSTSFNTLSTLSGDITSNYAQFNKNSEVITGAHLRGVYVIDNASQMKFNGASQIQIVKHHPIQ